jgi:hypothetical protein
MAYKCSLKTICTWGFRRFSGKSIADEAPENLHTSRFANAFLDIAIEQLKNAFLWKPKKNLSSFSICVFLFTIG